MTKHFLLGANREVDTSIQVVKVGQYIQMEGYSYDKYIVDIITHDSGDLTYKLINTRTYTYVHTQFITPLNQKFGIGYYYDSENPTYMTDAELENLKLKADNKVKADAEQAEKEKSHKENVSAKGRELLKLIVPDNTKGVIVARLRQDDSDHMTDYFGYRTKRTVILGFSKHGKNLFSEMRKCALNFADTTYLAERNDKHEHRETYSMGDGYYLGESKYNGWIIEKVKVTNREQAIEHFSYFAGEGDNIHIGKAKPPKNNKDNTPKDDNYRAECTLMEYSPKSVAVFGNTRPIREKLKEMGGAFNSRLKYQGGRAAGWIFSKAYEQELAVFFGLD